MQGHLHMQPGLPDNRFEVPSSSTSILSPHRHHHHHNDNQVLRSVFAKQQGCGQTRNPIAKRKVCFNKQNVNDAEAIDESRSGQISFRMKWMLIHMLLLNCYVLIFANIAVIISINIFLIIMFWSWKALIFPLAVKNHPNPGFSWSRSRVPESDTIQH